MRSLVCALALVVALSTATVAAGAPVGAAASNGITLVHQELALAPDADLSITVHPPSSVSGATIVVRAYQPVDNRDAYHRAIDRQLTRSIDHVDIESSTLTPDADGNITLVVHTETTTNAEDALRLPTVGLYPVTVRIVGEDDEAVSDLVTFVDRMPPIDATPLGAISVAVLATITAPPAIPGSNTALPVATSQAIDELTAYPSDAVLSLAISPDVLTRLDPSTLAAVRKVLAAGLILAQPTVPLDPSAATDAGLDDQFTQSLVDGAKTIADIGGFPAVKRDVWYASDGITDAGALLLRDLGTQLLVIPSSVYLAADGNINQYTDYSQYMQTVLAGNDDGSRTCDDRSVDCIDTAVIDPVISGRLVDTTLSDEQAALYTAADMVVYRDYFADDIAAGNPHALVLGIDGGGVPPAARLTRVRDMVTATGAAGFITIDDLERDSGPLIAAGQQVELRLPQPAPIDLTDRAKDLNDVTYAAKTVASMFVPDAAGQIDQRVDRWAAIIQSLYSSAVTDAQSDAAIASINADLKSVRDCVVPPTGYPFTVTGQSTNLPLRITNTCAFALKVKVHLEAAGAKMEFPPDDIEETLAPGLTVFTVPVTARTNGTFDITLDVLTPFGDDVRITPRVTLRARVSTLAGLPQVITGAGLLILLTWWARNRRRSRRARTTAEAMVSHPTTNGDALARSAMARSASERAGDRASDRAGDRASDRASVRHRPASLSDP